MREAVFPTVIWSTPSVYAPPVPLPATFTPPGSFAPVPEKIYRSIFRAIFSAITSTIYASNAESAISEEAREAFTSFTIS